MSYSGTISLNREMVGKYLPDEKLASDLVYEDDIRKVEVRDIDQLYEG